MRTCACACVDVHGPRTDGPGSTDAEEITYHNIPRAPTSWPGPGAGVVVVVVAVVVADAIDDPLFALPVVCAVVRTHIPQTHTHTAHTIS